MITYINNRYIRIVERYLHLLYNLLFSSLHDLSSCHRHRSYTKKSNKKNFLFIFNIHLCLQSLRHFSTDHIDLKKTIVLLIILNRKNNNE